MLARDVMTTAVVTARPETEVREIARTLLERRISAVPVVDAAGAVVGIVSEGDLMRRPESETEEIPSWWLHLVAEPGEKARDYVRSHGRHAADVMTRNVVTAAPDTPLAAVAGLLERHGIKRVPIVEEGRIVGIVSRANLLHGLAAQEMAPPSRRDGALKEAVLAELRKAGITMRFLNVVVTDGRIRLWGSVETPDEKRAARVAVENASGGAPFDDNLRIVPAMVVRTLWA